MRNAGLLLMAALLMSSTGCATVMRGGKQGMQFETDPPGAKLVVNGKEYTTPAKLELKRGEKYTVDIIKEGYRPVHVEMKSVWDGASLGNAVLPGGSIGVATDRVQAADMAFYPLKRVTLAPATRPSDGPIELIQYKKRYLTKEEYEAELLQEKEDARTDFPFEHR